MSFTASSDKLEIPVVIARLISVRRRSVSACNADAVIALKSSWSAAPFGDCVRRSVPTRRRSTSLVDYQVQQRRTDHHTCVTTKRLLRTIFTITPLALPSLMHLTKGAHPAVFRRPKAVNQNQNAPFARFDTSLADKHAFLITATLIRRFGDSRFSPIDWSRRKKFLRVNRGLPDQRGLLGSPQR
jgi:hypothetical protein